MATLKKVAKVAGTYTTFSILNRSVPFVLLPILTAYLTPADYGVVALFTAVALFLMPVVGLNANTIILQRYFKTSVRERQELLATTYVIMTVVLGVLILFWIGLGGYITELIKLDRAWLLIAIIAAYAGMVATMTTTLSQIRQESFKYGMFQLGQMLINVGLSLLLVVVLKYGWEGRLSAMVTSSLLMMVVAFYINYHQKDFHLPMLLKPKHMSATVKSGLILMLSSVAGAIASMSDRFLLAPMVSMDALGIYSVAVMFCQILEMVFSAIGMTYLPMFMSKINSSEHSERNKAIWSSYALVVMYFLLAGAFSIVAPYVMHVMLNERFHGATEFIVLLAFANAAIAASGIFTNHILAREANYTLSAVSVFTLVVTVALNVVLIKSHGAIGAAEAMLLAAIFTLIVNLAIALRHHGREVAQ